MVGFSKVLRAVAGQGSPGQLRDGAARRGDGRLWSFRLSSARSQAQATAAAGKACGNVQELVAKLPLDLTLSEVGSEERRHVGWARSSEAPILALPRRE